MMLEKQTAIITTRAENSAKEVQIKTQAEADKVKQLAQAEADAIIIKAEAQRTRRKKSKSKPRLKLTRSNSWRRQKPTLSSSKPKLRELGERSPNQNPG